MFDLLIYKFKINSLFNQRKKIIDAYAKEYKALNNKDKHSDEVCCLLAEEQSELDIIDYAIENTDTTFYLKKARKNFIDLSSTSKSDLWMESSLDPSRKVLNDKAISLIRKIVSKENKKKIEITSQIITSVTGLLGAIIGLLAILSK